MYTQYYTYILSIHHGVAPAVPLSTKMLQYSVQVYSVNCAMRCMVPPPSPGSLVLVIVYSCQC